MEEILQNSAAAKEVRTRSLHHASFRTQQAATRTDTAPARGYLSFSAQAYFVARWRELQPRPKTEVAIARAALALASETEHRFSHLNDLQCAAATSQPHTPPSQNTLSTLASEHDSRPRREQNTLEAAARALDNASSHADARIAEYHKAEAAAKKQRGF